MEKREEHALILGIATRAEEMNLVMVDKNTLVMDLKNATEEFKLRHEELLKADDFNFMHDVGGIQKNLNRDTKKMDNMFVPRYAGRR